MAKQSSQNKAKGKQETNMFNEDGTPTGSLLFGMIVGSLFGPPLLLNMVLPKILGEDATSAILTFTWFGCVLILLANLRFLLQLRKRDEERKFLNLVATFCSLWMFLHFATVPQGIFNDAISTGGLNFSALSFTIALGATFITCVVKLLSRWRLGSLLYKLAYLFIGGLALSILLYYATHREMFHTGA